MLYFVGAVASIIGAYVSIKYALRAKKVSRSLLLKAVFPSIIIDLKKYSRVFWRDISGSTNKAMSTGEAISYCLATLEEAKNKFGKVVEPKTAKMIQRLENYKEGARLASKLNLDTLDRIRAYLFSYPGINEIHNDLLHLIKKYEYISKFHDWRP